MGADDDDEAIPTSRAKRTAAVASLAASEAVKRLGTRAANLTRSEDEARAAMSRRQLESAKQLVAVLGTMKGAAMKVGQVMSFLDAGVVPDEHRDEFQRELAKLRDAAPTVSFKQMRQVIERDLEQPIKEIFSELDEEPIAAASIGQVYRGRLRDDGMEVAVKVQYPGVDDAVRADLQNMDMLMRVFKRIAPGMDAKAVAREIRERIGEELDYELEAQNQRALARIYDGHPFIVVPRVVSSLSRTHVMVSEFVDGFGFEELKECPQAERDRVGEIIFRFFLGCLYRHHQFSGDPHPGNFRVLGDGRVAFLDFGLFKRIGDSAVQLEVDAQKAVIDEDGEQLRDVLAGGGFLPQPEMVDPDALLAYVSDVIWWYTTDEPIELTPELATRVLIEGSDPRSRHFEAMRHQDMRPEHLFGRRMEMLTLAVLGQLRSTNNWRAVADEWIYDAEPRTELGVLETDFFKRR